MKHVDRCKHLMDMIGPDDLHFRPEDLVAIRVVVMPMRVDDVSYRLVSEFLDIFDEGPRRGRRGAGIHDHYIPIVDDDNVVAAEPPDGTRRVVNTIGDLLQLVPEPLDPG